MRRVLSILLALAFGLEPVAFAVGYDDSASLPACCRRHGAHHCAMDADATSPIDGQQTAAVKVPSHCPMFPARQQASPTSNAAVVLRAFQSSWNAPPALVEAPYVSRSSAASLRTVALRGPPTLIPS